MFSKVKKNSFLLVKRDISSKVSSLNQVNQFTVIGLALRLHPRGVHEYAKWIWKCAVTKHNMVGRVCICMHLLLLFSYVHLFAYYFFYITMRRRELRVKTLRSPVSADFVRHCVLSCGTQRRALYIYLFRYITWYKYFMCCQ